MLNFEPEPFHPAPWLPGAHAQSIGGSFLRRKNGVSFQRKRVETPDGDFFDFDFALTVGEPVFGAGSPLVLILHGLEGSAQSSYMYEMYRQLARQGLRAVGMNFRSCSGEMNRLLRLYHSGETSDLAHALETLIEDNPQTPIGAVGFSLGGNVLLKYLGEQQSRKPANLRAAAVISPPFDLASSTQVMSRGMGKIYLYAFLHRLKRKIRLKARLLEHYIDIQAALNAKSFHEFDNAVTAPLHGFQDADEYYAHNSSAQFIPGIWLPTLVLRSLDDPFFDPRDIPKEVIKENKFITSKFTQYGGHVGFVEKSKYFWAERQAAQFLAIHLNKEA